MCVSSGLTATADGRVANSDLEPEGLFPIHPSSSWFLPAHAHLFRQGRRDGLACSLAGGCKRRMSGWHNKVGERKEQPAPDAGTHADTGGKEVRTLGDGAVLAVRTLRTPADACSSQGSQDSSSH